MTERWADVPGHEGRYRVSADGRVRGPRGHDLTEVISNSGYAQVRLEIDGKQVLRYVHRLMLEAFFGPPPGKRDGAHGNGKRRDNRLENLEWKTRRENLADRDRHGTHQRGLRGNGAKLTLEQVRAIRAAPTYQEALALGLLCRSGVFAVRSHSRYKDVT
jgi:hypothetical protein